MIQCGHCGLYFTGSDQDVEFFRHHQQVHVECPDWEPLQKSWCFDLGNGKRLDPGDPPHPFLLLRN